MNKNIAEINLRLAPVKQWLPDEALEKIYSSEYWNDIDEEKKKDMWIADGDYAKCLDYMTRAGLLKEWAVVTEFMADRPSKNELKVADLAAGIGWSSALFSRMDQVAEVSAMEMSKHRLIQLLPYAVDMFHGVPEKIKRYIGSFYDLDFQDESMDVVFLSQAFHHADQPLRLLGEIDRVIRKGGVVFLSGENFIPMPVIIKRVIKKFLTQGKFETNFYELFPADSLSGDHYYRLADYYMFFKLLGYRLQHKIIDKKSLILMAEKI